MLNNQQFIIHIAKGDQSKFRLLMELTSDELLCFALGFVRNRELAEEIVSDVFVNIWKKRTDLIQINNLRSYLYICVKNGCLSQLRKTKNDKIVYLDEIGDYYFLQTEAQDNETIDEEILNQIYAAIDLLPPKCKMAFTLAKINGLKHKEIAEIMEVSPKTVNNHLVLAVKKIIETIDIHAKRNNNFSPLKKASFYSLFF